MRVSRELCKTDPGQNPVQRARLLVEHFDSENTPDEFYWLTDGGGGLCYAEEMADVIEQLLPLITGG